MQKHAHYLTILILTAIVGCSNIHAANDWQSTRVTGATQHARSGEDRYPFREHATFILGELDLRHGDVVVDIGAGDGWWSRRLAQRVGETGTVYAGEVEQEKVDDMTENLADLPQITPRLIPTDSTDLPENSLDMAFFSQVYHHLDEDGRVDYLRHLRRVVKPTGRLAIIEKYPVIATQVRPHGTRLSRLVRAAEQAGWVAVRCELITGSYHYLAIFVQKDLFPPEPQRERRSDAPSTGHTNDSLETVRENLDEHRAVLLDVREANEWDAGHLNQADLLPLSELREAAQTDKFARFVAEQLPADTIIYVHCRSGGRALVATQLLRELDYDVRPLAAGHSALLEAGFAPAQPD